MGADLAGAAGASLSTPGSRVELIDGTGHFLHLERPELVNDLVVGFVTESSG